MKIFIKILKKQKVIKKNLNKNKKTYNKKSIYINHKLIKLMQKKWN